MSALTDALFLEFFDMISVVRARAHVCVCVSSGFTRRVSAAERGTRLLSSVHLLLLWLRQKCYVASSATLHSLIDIKTLKFECIFSQKKYKVQSEHNLFYYFFYLGFLWRSVQIMLTTCESERIRKILNIQMQAN